MEDLSIHPRHSMYKSGIKKNTAKPYKKAGKGKLGKRMRKLNQRRLSHAAMLKALPSNVNPACYKTPGSMKK